MSRFRFIPAALGKINGIDPLFLFVHQSTINRDLVNLLVACGELTCSLRIFIVLLFLRAEQTGGVMTQPGYVTQERGSVCAIPLFIWCHSYFQQALAKIRHSLWLPGQWERARGRNNQPGGERIL